MRSLSIRIKVIASALLFAAQLSAQNASNPIQIALLRWYQANTAAQIASCLPEGLAFDGSHIWVGCRGTFSVEKFNASDGALVANFSMGSSVNIFFLLFDGANIWISNRGNAEVTEMNASTGAIVRTVSVGSTPSGMAFDGTNIWVANAGSNTVSIITAATGAMTSSATFTNCGNPSGLVYDNVNSHVWVSCHYSNSIAMLDSSGNVLGTPVTVGPYPTYMAFDGKNIWVSNTTSSGSVSEVNVATMTAALPIAVGQYPEGIAFDTMYIWVANTQSGSVTKILASTGAVVGTYPLPAGASPEFVGFDGGNLWVTDHALSTLHKM